MNASQVVDFSQRGREKANAIKRITNRQMKSAALHIAIKTSHQGRHFFSACQMLEKRAFFEIFTGATVFLEFE
jgi:hypothetical protein